MRIPPLVLVTLALVPSALSLASPPGSPPHFVALAEGRFALDATSDCKGAGHYVVVWEPARSYSPLVPAGGASFDGAGSCDPDPTVVPVHADQHFDVEDCAPVGDTGLACAGEGVSFRLEDDGSFAFVEVYSDGQVLSIEGVLIERFDTS